MYGYTAMTSCFHGVCGCFYAIGESVMVVTKTLCPAEPKVLSYRERAPSPALPRYIHIFMLQVDVAGWRFLPTQSNLSIRR